MLPMSNPKPKLYNFYSRWDGTMSRTAMNRIRGCRSSSATDAESFFFQAKWPQGYCCPRCSHRHGYRLRSRSIPLYQCAHCRHQTSLTSGTIMEHSRLSLEQWRSALQFMTQPGSVTAVQLQRSLGISYKSAWYMLKRARLAISMVDMEQRLCGFITAGLDFYGGGGGRSYYRKPREHSIVALQGVVASQGSSSSPSSETDIVKLKIVNPALMVNRRMPAVLQPFFFRQHLEPHDLVLHPAPLTVGIAPDTTACQSMQRFIYHAKQWIDVTFHGIGAKYLQLYWDEYCFRENCRRQGRSPLRALASACSQRCL